MSKYLDENGNPAGYNVDLTKALAEVAEDDIPRSNPASGFIDKIRRMSLRGKKIVEQLLDYSRKSMETPKPVDAAMIVKETLKTFFPDISNSKRNWNLFHRKQEDVIQQGAVKNPYVKKTIERDRVAIYGT